MTILCIETSTSVCSAALCVDGRPVAQQISREGANHARLLPLYVQDMLACAREHRLTVEAVALSQGPGSYTGLRIGTSMAKGLCYGLRVPLIAVPTPEVLCEAAGEQPAGSLLCPMIDARRMEVYTALYDRDLQPQTEIQAAIIDRDWAEGKEAAGQTICYFGDGAAKCREILSGGPWHYLPDIVPEAQYMGRLAEQKAARGEGLQAEAVAYYEPFYLKEFVAAQSHVKGLK